LQTLLDFFPNAETPHDAALIKAMFLTPAWGGYYGERAAFAILAPDRGCGKSALAQAVGLLYGRMISVDLTRDAEEHLATRLLSAEGMVSRLVLLDNLKRSANSSVIEHLISDHWISGQRLYHGEGRRPNTLTWILTGNGLRLSKDMARRCFLVRVKQPAYSANWQGEMSAYINAHREEILADIVATLAAPLWLEEVQGESKSAWTNQVLGRVCASQQELAECLAMTRQRRMEQDDDTEEASLISDALREAAREIPGGELAATRCAEVVSRALGRELSVQRAGHLLASHIEAGRLAGVTKRRTNRGASYQIRDTSPAPLLGTPATGSL
jgi:hypothetical protein